MEILSERGTKIYNSLGNTFSIKFKLKKSMNSKKFHPLWMIHNEKIAPISILFPEWKINKEITINPNTTFMLINLSSDPIGLSFNGINSLSLLKVIYDPYIFENEVHKNIDPKNVKKFYSEINNDYIDILAKWYSVKFSYKDYNIIFLRPELGLSFQQHELRLEKWEILNGHPIIITDSTVNYNVDKGSKFIIDRNTLHTIINPSTTEWVVLREEYEGTFDENDIVRIFNPNHYH